MFAVKQTNKQKPLLQKITDFYIKPLITGL